MEAKEKKHVPLRLSASLYKEIVAWADDDFRSINGQIEYLLTECVRKRKGDRRAPGRSDAPGGARESEAD